MPPVHRRRRAGGTKRAGVLDAVTSVLADRGYEQTRFADVAAASGVAISTLQTYFGSREDMVVEALEHATEREVEALEAVAATESDPWKRLVALTDRSLQNSTSTQQLLVEFWRAGIRDEELRRHNEEIMRRYRAPYLAAVADGTHQGSFAPIHSPAEVTDFLITALVGAVVIRALLRSEAAAAGFRRVLLEQLATMLGSRSAERIR